MPLGPGQNWMVCKEQICKDRLQGLSPNRSSLCLTSKPGGGHCSVQWSPVAAGTCNYDGGKVSHGTFTLPFHAPSPAHLTSGIDSEGGCESSSFVSNHQSFGITMLFPKESLGSKEPGS